MILEMRYFVRTWFLHLRNTSELSIALDCSLDFAGVGWIAPHLEQVNIPTETRRCRSTPNSVRQALELLFLEYIARHNLFAVEPISIPLNPASH